MPPYKCRVEVFPKKDLLDPAAQAVEKNVPRVDSELEGRVSDFHMGKVMEFVLEAASAEEAQEKTDYLGENLLSNPVIEDYSATTALAEEAE
jgi:phosphoribosylformylglycinamidine synthase PurS subunit